MDQVLEAALRRKPKALVATPPTVVEGGDEIRPEPEPRVRRSSFPPTDQPPVAVMPDDVPDGAIAIPVPAPRRRR